MISVYRDTLHDSRKVNLSNLGLSFLEFNVNSLESDVQTEKVDSTDGEFVTHSQFLSRNIDAKLYIKSRNNKDFQNKKTEIYKLFNAKQKLLIVDERLNMKKIWTTYTSNSFKVENNITHTTGEFELIFTSESPYATVDYSVIAKKETGKGEFHFFSPTQVTEVAQVEANNIFYIENGGDVVLDGREHKIHFEFRGDSNKLRLVNENNGSQWQYKEETTERDTIELDSIYPYKNRVNIFDDTNYGYIKLNKGTNKFRIYGSDKFEIKFEFSELYI